MQVFEQPTTTISLETLGVFVFLTLPCSGSKGGVTVPVVATIKVYKVSAIRLRNPLKLSIKLIGK